MARKVRLYALHKRVAGTFVRCTDLALPKATAVRFYQSYLLRGAMGMSGVEYRLKPVPAVTPPTRRERA